MKHPFAEVLMDIAEHNDLSRWAVADTNSIMENWTQLDDCHASRLFKFLEGSPLIKVKRWVEPIRLNGQVFWPIREAFDVPEGEYVWYAGDHGALPQRNCLGIHTGRLFRTQTEAAKFSKALQNMLAGNDEIQGEDDED